jgi:hypothetical protein
VNEAVPWPETEPRLRLLRDNDLDGPEITEELISAVLSVGSSSRPASVATSRSLSSSSSSSSSRSSPA